jgi:hypothetical protein
VPFDSEHQQASDHPVLYQGGAVVVRKHGLQGPRDFNEVGLAGIVTPVVYALPYKIGVVDLPFLNSEGYPVELFQEIRLGLVHGSGDVKGGGIGHHHAHFPKVWAHHLYPLVCHCLVFPVLQHFNSQRYGVPFLLAFGIQKGGLGNRSVPATSPPWRIIVVVIYFRREVQPAAIDGHPDRVQKLCSFFERCRRWYAVVHLGLCSRISHFHENGKGVCALLRIDVLRNQLQSQFHHEYVVPEKSKGKGHGVN